MRHSLTVEMLCGVRWFCDACLPMVRGIENYHQKIFGPSESAPGASPHISIRGIRAHMCTAQVTLTGCSRSIVDASLDIVAILRKKLPCALAKCYHWRALKMRACGSVLIFTDSGYGPPQALALSCSTSARYEYRPLDCWSLLIESTTYPPF